MLAGLGMLKLTEKARLDGDAAIGIVSSSGIAAGVILASISGGFNVDLFSYLFGNILAISHMEVIISLSLSLILITVVILYYEELLSITFNEESAKTTGIKASRINNILVCSSPSRWFSP
jgi:zinc transport system permease protein